MLKKLESSNLGLNTSKFFMNTSNIITTKLEANVLGTGGENHPNGSKILTINVIKIFNEHDVNDVKKVRIKCFWAKEAEMSLRPLTSSVLPITDIKIFHEHDKHDH